MKWTVILVILLAGCAAPPDTTTDVAAAPAVRTVELAKERFEATFGQDARLDLAIPAPGRVTGTVDLGESTASRIELATPCGSETLGGGTGIQHVPDGPTWSFACEVDRDGLVSIETDGLVEGTWTWQWTG